LNLKDSRIREIIQNCISFLNETSTVEDDKKDIDEYNIWRAYSWIEYCILLVRLDKYNLLDEPPTLNDKKTTVVGTTAAAKKTKMKVDEKIMIRQVRDLLLNLNYKDDQKLIASLREIRDLLKVMVKDRQKKHNKITQK
jgi:hypothetical protein